MPIINYVDHEGNETQANVKVGTSVMQGAVDNNVENIVAECGGGCACGTCHVYVDEAWLGKLEPIGSMEEGMLSGVTDPKPNSRLSCQIDVTEELDGLIVRVPEEQF